VGQSSGCLRDADFLTWPCLNRLFFVLLALALPSLRSATADQADDYLREQMAQHRIAGAALKVIKTGKDVKTAAYGLANIELNVPATPDTVFEIGSLTKQFSAAGILLLAQEGRVNINDSITRYLKSAPLSWTNITVRHLLTHTSGLKSYTGLDGFELRRKLTEPGFIKRIAAQPTEFNPGESWKYCNTGFNLLGYIIENVSGTNYWDFMRARIFGPLGMNSTTDRQPANIVTNRASGYEQTNRILFNRDYDLTDVFSAGAIVSTIGDLERWNAALDGERLLTSTTRKQMWTPAILNNGKSTKYGFGWFIETVNDRRIIGHSGSTSGFSASIQRFPDDNLTVILLTNTDEQIATTLARRIAEFYR